jgi:hypothetical protein
LLVLAGLALSLPAGCGSAPRAGGAAPVAAEEACFGGKPEVFSTDWIVFQSGSLFNTPMLVVEGHIIWQMVEEVVQLDLAKGRGSLASDAYLKAADNREAFAWSFAQLNQPESKLVAIDLDTGKRRIVTDEAQDHPFPWHSHLVLDGEFLYYIDGDSDGSCSPDKDDGFYRMRRDGRGRPERLAAEPSCATNRFLMQDGFVYWHQFPRHGMPPALWRRRLAPDAPLQQLGTALEHPLPMALGRGRLYYLDGKRLASVPIDGSAPAVEHFRVADVNSRSTLLHDRGCLYWNAGRTLMRAKLGAGGPGEPEMIADQANYSLEGAIATDGKHLYWMDQDRKRIMRSARSAKARPQ